MTTLQVHIPATKAFTYPIYIGANILHKILEVIPIHTSTVVIITDETVASFYLDDLKDMICNAGFKVISYCFPAGEESKTITTKNAIEDFMLTNSCDRNTVILAFGGGVVGDLAGFIAATYMRGIPYIQIPTTLMAMVDSSVGGKTAINTALGKNLIGAYWQPLAVITEVNYLKTLPKMLLINGAIEAIKMFLTSHFECLQFFKENLHDFLQYDEATLIYLIEQGVKIKANVVSQDEKDSGVRQILNFGHTIGHALEAIANYQLLHGYAVALGILVETKIAELSGYLDSKHYLYIRDLLSDLGITMRSFDSNQIVEHTRIDKKNKCGSVNYIILNKLGSVYYTKNEYSHAVSDNIVLEAIRAVSVSESISLTR